MDYVDIPCENAATLVPSYLDGQLREQQAAPLRKHLLACPACREIAKDETALKRWFVEGGPAQVPQGFAARVARRAFAGDTGELLPRRFAGGPEGLQPGANRIQSFVLTATAIAAGLLLILSVAIRQQELPASDDLHGQGISEILNQLEGLNEGTAEALEAEEDAATPTEPSRSDR